MKFPALFALALATAASPVAAQELQQILETGSFEWPPVTARKARADGADLSKSAMNAEWLVFRDKPDAEGGELKLGLTNEIFRTGRQSIFVEFNKLTKPSVVAELSSTMIPILPNQDYHVAIWGRMDRKRPITLAQRLPMLKLRVDWFKAGEEEEDGPYVQTGDPVWKIQPIPGPPKRPPFFVTDRWKPYFADIKSPEDATFIKITWTFESAPSEGETDGVIYFDDAVLEGQPGKKVDPLDELEMEEAEREKAAGTGGAETPAPADMPKSNGAKPEAESKPAEPAKPAAPAKQPAKKESEMDLTPVR